MAILFYWVDGKMMSVSFFEWQIKWLMEDNYCFEWLMIGIQGSEHNDLIQFGGKCLSNEGTSILEC